MQGPWRARLISKKSVTKPARKSGTKKRVRPEAELEKAIQRVREWRNRSNVYQKIAILLALCLLMTTLAACDSSTPDSEMYVEEDAQAETTKKPSPWMRKSP